MKQELQSVTLDIEVDLGNYGGLLRFKNIGELDDWIEKEEEFWSWLQDANRPSPNRQNILGNRTTAFSQYKQYRPAISAAENFWTNTKRSLSLIHI